VDRSGAGEGRRGDKVGSQKTGWATGGNGATETEWQRKVRKGNKEGGRVAGAWRLREQRSGAAVKVLEKTKTRNLTAEGAETQRKTEPHAVLVSSAASAPSAVKDLFSDV
jgi:hypothetical protein